MGKDNTSITIEATTSGAYVENDNGDEMLQSGLKAGLQNRMIDRVN